MSLIFQEEPYSIESLTFDDKEIRYRAFEHRVYCDNPVDPEHQELSIYVPEEFYESGKAGKYDIRSAPVFMPNTVGGFRPGYFQRPGEDHHGKTTMSAIALYLGYVVVVPVVRGIGLKDDRDTNIGTVPAALADLKAAVRYLRYNDARIPGNKERIISNGTSAGGTLSALLGATGNHPDFEPYLRAIGAAEGRDDIYAASCYCPITDLDHADIAYEWEFGKLTEYNGMRLVINEEAAKENGVSEEMLDSLYHNGHPDFSKLPEDLRRKIVERVPFKEEMTTQQKYLSRDLAREFPGYLNSLGLRDEKGNMLSINADGSGTFRNWLLKQVVKGMETAVLNDQDLRRHVWIDFHNDRPVGFDWNSFVGFRTRMKPAPAFDKPGEPGSNENKVFGSARIDCRHFTQFSYSHDLSGWPKVPNEQVKLYNPLYYIADPRAVKARQFRIRAGALDRDTSLAVSAILALALKNSGISTDYAIPWDIPHAGDYDPGELFLWVHNILK